MTDARETDHDPGRPGLDAVDITACARAACGGPVGASPPGELADLPFDTAGLGMTELEDPVLPEPPRRGRG